MRSHVQAFGWMHILYLFDRLQRYRNPGLNDKGCVINMKHSAVL